MSIICFWLTPCIYMYMFNEKYSNKIPFIQAWSLLTGNDNSVEFRTHLWISLNKIAETCPINELKLKFEIDIVPRSVPECWAGCCLVSVRRVTSASVGWWPYSARRTMRHGPYTRSITLSVTKGKTHSIIIIEREKVWLQMPKKKYIFVSHCSTLNR